VGLHPYHIFRIGVVRVGGGLHPYHIFRKGVVRGGGFIHIIYSEKALSGGGAKSISYFHNRHSQMRDSSIFIVNFWQFAAE
jgi:hypothetical protein